MTVPLPGGKADELIRHFGGCEECRAAKAKKNRKYCKVGRRLIQEVLKERHGISVDE